MLANVIQWVFRCDKKISFILYKLVESSHFLELFVLTQFGKKNQNLVAKIVSFEST